MLEVPVGLGHPVGLEGWLGFWFWICRQVVVGSHPAAGPILHGRIALVGS